MFTMPNQQYIKPAVCSAACMQALIGMLSSWLSRRFFSGWCESCGQLCPALVAAQACPCPNRHTFTWYSAVLFPMVVTVYITWWFLTFFDNFFSVSDWVLSLLQ